MLVHSGSVAVMDESNEIVSERVRAVAQTFARRDPRDRRSPCSC